MMIKILVWWILINIQSSIQMDSVDDNNIYVGVAIPNSANEPFSRHISFFDLNYITFVKFVWETSLTVKDVLDAFCNQFFPNNVSAIIFIADSKSETQNAFRYFMQLSNHFGIPVISWNAKSDSFEKSLPNSVIVQLFPTVAVQVQAMLAILSKYQWQTFCLITSSLDDNNEFFRSLNNRKDRYGLKKLADITLKVNDDVETMFKRLSIFKKEYSECRTFLLHVSEHEAQQIFPVAKLLGLTGREYRWIVTQSALSLNGDPQVNYPEIITPKLLNPILAVNKNRSSNGLVQLFYTNGAVWASSARSSAVLSINIVQIDSQKKWQKVGTWFEHSLNIDSINLHTQDGNNHYTISFLEESPFIIMKTPNDGKCSKSETVCKVPEINWKYLNRCCSGFFIDFLVKLSDTLDFSFDLKRVNDGEWGEPINGTWNGLIGELVNNQTDMVVSSLTINSERQKAVNFSDEIISTGISIVVAKKTGFATQQPFLQPFDTLTWLIIVFVIIQVVALLIFFFEWHSPFGIKRKKTLTKKNNFALTQTYWLTLTMLFKAPSSTITPKGWSSRMIVSSWACFALVFIAIYTAQLADYMIAREIFYDFKGIKDTRLLNPHSQNPPLKFGTVPFGNTATIIKMNFPEMFEHMKQFFKVNVSEGIEAVKSGQLDAFLYDGAVLDYLVRQDKDCQLITVGAWHGQSGYGVAFSPKFIHRERINTAINEIKNSDTFSELERKWFGEPCKPRQKYKKLSLEQFISVFFVLGFGVLLSIIIFLIEQCYSKCIVRANRATTKKEPA